MASQTSQRHGNTAWHGVTGRYAPYLTKCLKMGHFELLPQRKKRFLLWFGCKPL